MTAKKKKILGFIVILTLSAASGATYMAYRAFRGVDITLATHSQIRYLIQSGGTIGEVPASQTFSADYLEAIFGENPALLDKLKSVVSRGLDETPNISLGEVAAMLVTYRAAESNQVTDIVAHVIGGFPITKRKPGMHRDGYFKGLIDNRLWDMSNSMVGYLGRDMVLFAEDHLIQQQEELLESLFSGTIMPLVDSLDEPLYFTAVFPDPRHIVPRPLRKHVQAVIVKGSLGQSNGHFETLILSPSGKSAAFALASANDCRRMAEVALRTKWRAVPRTRSWGEIQIDPWWAYEMYQNLQTSTLEREENIVTMRTEFDRVMVNVVLKTIERMSRDLTQMRYSLDDKLDPRVADQKLATSKPQHYWSEEHRWGPNWPIAPTAEELAMAAAAAETPGPGAGDAPATPPASESP